MLSFIAHATIHSEILIGALYMSHPPKFTPTLTLKVLSYFLLFSSKEDEERESGRAGVNIFLSFMFEITHFLEE